MELGALGARRDSEDENGLFYKVYQIETKTSLNLMKSLDKVGIEVSSALSSLSVFSGCKIWFEDIAQGACQRRGTKRGTERGNCLKARVPTKYQQ